ncbi:MAG TPA: histidine kinase [Acidobacteriota bacterium]|nr:histidine kinase [Acidobacteriota bacterium]HNJ42262.1 histidine kinase [Acidobacteriota bacterium]
MANDISQSDQKRNQKFVWLMVFGFFTINFLLLFSYRYLDDLTRFKSGTFLTRLIEEMTGAYTAMLLVPIVFWSSRQFRLYRPHLLKSLAAHLGTVLFQSFLHTSLMAVTRQAIFFLFGLGVYDYGYMPLRYLMEFPNQLLWYSAVVGFIHLFDRYQELRDQELRASRLESQLAQSRLQALQLQLQPHFLFNTLNTISAVLYEDIEKADRMIARLSDFLRATLKTASSQQISLGDEIEFLNLYLEIMQARFEEQLAVTLEIEAEARPALVPRLVLQPLVENALKHGVDQTTGKIRIDVSAKINGAHLELEVSDQGPGLNGNGLASESTKVGLANLRERLQVLYPEHHTLAVHNGDHAGLTVHMTLPLQTSLQEKVPA